MENGHSSSSKLRLSKNGEMIKVMPLSPQKHWIIESNTKKLNAYLFVMAALGCVFLYLTKGQTEESLNHLYAHWVGVVLVLLAICVFLFHEDTRILVDEERRELIFQKKDRFGSRSYSLPFTAVQSVDVVSIGKSHRGIVTHHLTLQLRNAKRETPGRFSTSQAEVAEEAERLANAIGCECRIHRKYHPANAANFGIAVLGAILIYLIWYRLTVGPWCQAMWFGSAPVLIIGFSFLSIFRISRRSGM